MTLGPIAFAGVLLAAATVVRAQDAPAAQPPPERRVALDPASALTGGEWTFTLATFDGYDWARYKGVAGQPAFFGADESMLASGQRAGASAKVSAMKRSGDSTFTLQGSSTASYYGVADDLLASADVTASQSTRIGRHTSVSAAETFSYAPYYSLDLFPALNTFAGTELSEPQSPSFDLALQATPVLRYGGSGHLTHLLTDRTDVSASYSIDGARVEGLSTTEAVWQTAGAWLSHRFSRIFDFKLGYRAMAASFQMADRPTLFHTVDIGLNARKAWSRTRRTTFSVSTGSTVQQHEDGFNSPARAVPGAFQVTGNAALVHYTGRTWSTRVAYRRDWQLLEGVASPFFTDGLSVGTSGAFTGRTTGGLNGSYLLGSLQGGSAERRGSAYFGTSWLAISLNGGLRLFGQYTYYRQQFQNQLPALNLPFDVNRHGVRAGLVLQLPSGRSTR